MNERPMRALRVLIVIAGMLAIAGVASAQNDPCPECDPDGNATANNSYHSVDAGLIDTNGTVEALADTDASHSYEGDEKGFWLWFSLCLSAFVEKIEEALSIETDVDANVEVYTDSEGTDVDASVTGVQHYCTALANMTGCDLDFDESELGDADGMTYEAIATAEATTGVDVFVPAVLPDTGDDDTNVCVNVDVIVSAIC